MSYFSSFFVALFVSMALVPLFMRLAHKLKLVDVPNARKVHSAAVPRSGGLAIVAGFAASLIMFKPTSPELVGIIIGGFIIAAFGFLDDRNDLSYKWKFFGQFVAAVVAVSSGLVIEVWPFLGIEPVAAWLSIPVTIVFLIGVTNAINLSDGLDGLAAGTSLITLSALAWLFWSSGNTVMVAFSLAVIGSICGFLRYNNHPALVFMGDTGSQFLGFITGCLAIILCQKTNVALNSGLFLLLVGLPILDTIFVMLWRIRNGDSPFMPDKNHLHHRLLEFGLRQYEAVSIIYLMQAALVAFAVIFRYQADLFIVSSYLIFAFTVMWFFRWARLAEFRFRDTSGIRNQHEPRNHWLLDAPGLPRFFERLTEFLASGFLIFGAIYSRTVSEQFGWLAAAVAAVALLAGFIPKRGLNNLLRVIVFLAGVSAVYAMLGEPRFSFAKDWHINAYMIVLGLCLISTIRLTKSEFFRTSPLDVLIIIFVLAVVVATTLTDSTVMATQLADTAIRLAVFFYVGEYLSNRQKESFRVLPLAAMGAMTIIAARGLLA